MTTLGLGEQLTFGGVDLASYATLVTNLQGFDEFPGIRGENAPITGLAGRQFLEKLYDERRPAAGLIVTGLSTAGVAPGNDRTGARANLDALYAVLAPQSRPQTLTRKMPDASVRSALASVASVSNFTNKVNGRVFALLVTFDMPDPFFYGAAVVDSARSIAASPTSFTLTNPGSAPGCYRLAFDFAGPIANPRVTNQDTGTTVAVLTTVATGSHLVIDCYAFTALLDGANVEGLLTYSGAVPFLTVAPGANHLVVSADTLGGTLTTQLYPAFM